MLKILHKIKCLITKPTVGSLFSGGGGLDLGFEWQGFKPLWFVENDLHSQTILRKNHRNAEIYGDIENVDFRKVKAVDVIIGGFPCQDISKAGKGIGIQGTRSSLWKYYAEAIRILRPKFALVENVPELANKGLNVVLADLAQIGYDAEWHCVPASAIGANHRRLRMFIIAYPKKAISQGIFEKREQTKRFKLKEIPREVLEAWHYQLSEPPLLGTSNGIPNRVYHIERLGNAVVPQVAEIFAAAIKEKIKR